MTGGLIGDLQGHTNAVFIVTISSDDKRLYSGAWDFKIIIRDWMKRIAETIISDHTHQVCALVLTDDDQFLVSGGCDTFVRVWDASPRLKN